MVPYPVRKFLMMCLPNPVLFHYENKNGLKAKNLNESPVTPQFLRRDRIISQQCPFPSPFPPPMT